MSKISVHTDYFSSKDRVFDEIEMNGLHLVEMNVPAVKNESHWHEFTTWLYILQGELLITDVEQDRTFKAGPGSRVDVPERVLHTEESSGYQIIAGMSALPKDPNHVDLSPETL